MQVKESPRRVSDINNNANEFTKSCELKIKHVKTAPKKVLPESPINTFDGYQLRIKNPKIDPAKGKIELSTRNDEEIIITIKQPPTRPSIPSIKFEKFIIAVPVIIIIEEIIKKINTEN